MTDKYHPVTREERCNHECVCLTYHYGNDKGKPCEIKCCGGSNCSNDTRNIPDPIALLEAWRKYHIGDSRHLSLYEIDREDEIIKRLRENPEAVREQGVREGWWVE